MLRRLRQELIQRFGPRMLRFLERRLIRGLLATDTPSVHVKTDSIAFVEDARMARVGAVSVTFEVEAPSVGAGRSSMTFAMDVPRAHGWAVPSFGCRCPHGSCGGRTDRVLSGFLDDSCGSSDLDGFNNVRACDLCGG